MDLVLDTCIMLAYVRSTDYIIDPIEKELIETDRTQTLIMSAVSRGELLSFGLQHDWGQNKKDRAEEVMRGLVQVGLDSADLFRVYAQVDAFSKPLGITMGKNDLWIAATAIITDAALVTTDDDFNHLEAFGLKISNYSYILKERELRRKNKS